MKNAAIGIIEKIGISDLDWQMLPEPIRSNLLAWWAETQPVVRPNISLEQIAVLRKYLDAANMTAQSNAEPKARKLLDKLQHECEVFAKCPQSKYIGDEAVTKTYHLNAAGDKEVGEQAFYTSVQVTIEHRDALGGEAEIKEFWELMRNFLGETFEPYFGRRVHVMTEEELQKENAAEAKLWKDGPTY